MKRPRVRIGTLMLLVVIAGLVAALVVRERATRREIADLKEKLASVGTPWRVHFQPAFLEP